MEEKHLSEQQTDRLFQLANLTRTVFQGITCGDGPGIMRIVLDLFRKFLHLSLSTLTVHALFIFFTLFENFEDFDDLPHHYLGLKNVSKKSKIR